MIPFNSLGYGDKIYIKTTKYDIDNKTHYSIEYLDKENWIVDKHHTLFMAFNKRMAILLDNGMLGDDNIQIIKNNYIHILQTKPFEVEHEL